MTPITLMHHMVVSGMYAWGAARSLFPTLVPYSFCPGPTRGACMMLLLGTTRPGPPPPPPPCPYKRYMQDDACPLAGPTCMRGTFGAYPSACCVVPGCMQPPGVGYMVVYRPPPPHGTTCMGPAPHFPLPFFQPGLAAWTRPTGPAHSPPRWPARGGGWAWG